MIFDLDGILVDSEVHWRAGFRETIDALAVGAGLEPLGIPDDELVAYEGGRVPDTIQSLVRAYLPALAPLSPERLGEATDTCVAASSRRIAVEPRRIDDSVQAARDLHDAGFTLAVASSSAGAFIDAALLSIGLDDVFEVRESAFDVEHAKPHPEVYLKAMAALATDASRCVAVEDSVTGVRASLAAGLSTIWRTSAPRTLDGVVPLSEHDLRAPGTRPWLIAVTQVSSDTIASAYP
ncbi:HAD family hydrolase [Nocardioides baculatus]|uniref:HAD family phosphatase n=1 Tax=Nocardioides baculatus TaxID=2801337 RepID=A0ABS1L443_9ACTN|nr:HAD family phosphatase [Nocardioides baculatus]MBL0746360.1 HAD family phosphatase [Nocardioides baculatus]